MPYIYVLRLPFSFGDSSSTSGNFLRDVTSFYGPGVRVQSSGREKSKLRTPERSRSKLSVRAHSVSWGAAYPLACVRSLYWAARALRERLIH